MSGSIVLEEDLDPDYEPSLAEVCNAHLSLTGCHRFCWASVLN